MLADGGFREDHQLRCAAEKAFAEEEAKRRLERAAYMGRRKAVLFVPGELVYYWRKQLPHKEQQIFRSGRFLGPARVIATETREDHGTLRPGNIVWLHRAGRLIKAAPEQLRRATEFEQQIEELAGPVHIPWTISTLASCPTRRTYVDISQDIPTEEDWEMARDSTTGQPGTELGVSKTRLLTKTTVPFADTEMTVENEASSSPRGTKRPDSSNPGGEGSASEIRRKNQRTDEDDALAAYFADEAHRQSVEIEIELPESNRKWKRFLQHPESYFSQQLKRKQVEVREKTLTVDEAKKFAEAKSNEVKNFIAAECFKLVEGKNVNPKDVLGMRWLLTWKYDKKYEDNGGRKAKARAIVLGYQDPNYEHRQTSAPTPSKAGRQLFFQTCAWRKFRLAKGDVSGAFLQGLNLEEELWCQPVPEICEEMGVSSDTPMLLTKAAYGLVQAPLHWYNSICEFLAELGYHRLVTEPCCWIYLDDEGQVCSIIHGHVDDFMFGGAEFCPIHSGLMKKIMAKYKWGEFEQREFIQCGVKVRQDGQYNIHLSQEQFIEELSEIDMSRDRQRRTDLPTTDAEKSQLRGVLGSLSWLCGQTCFQFSVDVNFLISTIPVSTEAELVKANQLVRNVKKWKAQQYTIHSFSKSEDLVMACWVDAGWANRPNNVDSTEGIFVGMAPAKLEHGAECNISPISWRSGKISRTCRSPAAAETMAALNGEDDLLYLRSLWMEMQGAPLNSRYPSETAKLLRGLLVTDARNLWDKVHRPTVSVKGAEKRADIEAISLREHVSESNIHLAWVHGGAQIANGLTKTTEKHQTSLFIQLGFRWRIVYDEQRRSEKQRRHQGLAPLEGQRDTQHTYSDDDADG